MGLSKTLFQGSLSISVVEITKQSLFVCQTIALRAYKHDGLGLSTTLLQDWLSISVVEITKQSLFVCQTIALRAF